MGQTLSGDQLRAAFRKLGEIQRQLGQNSYPYDPKGLLIALQNITQGQFRTGADLFPTEVFAPELIPKGARIIEDVEPTKFETGDLELVTVAMHDDLILFMDMIEHSRAVGANLGLTDAGYLVEHYEEIPTEASGKFLAFPGTLLLSHNYELCMPILRVPNPTLKSWGSSRNLAFVTIFSQWIDIYSLVRCKRTNNK